ncbi:MAG: site-specific DNA-methyltransferase [Firmicutes bacterium]|nr:site-specific DNA-methyltransferase [Bacillota bacterium]
MSILYELSGIADRAKAAAQALARGDKDLPKDCVVKCDNLDFLALHAGSSVKVDFIYIDPPFYSGANYKARIVEDGEVKTPEAYSDKWDSFADFLEALAVRIMLMREILSPSGTLAVHLDTRAAHYVKILMDEIFGPDRLVNELIWSYKSGGASTKCFSKKHDTILLYSGTAKYYFQPQKERSYNRGGKPYRFKGVEEFQDEDGRWYTMVNRKDVFNVDMVGRTSSERTGYATQKPEKLMEILIKSCCPEGGLCADFYCGSGSFGAAAKKLGRHYLLCDSSELAVKISAERLGEPEPVI